MPDKVAQVSEFPPRALIVTIYGLYARDAPGWLSVSSLIRLLAEMGVEEPAVRSAVSRLKRREILESRRIDGVAGYALPLEGRAVLEEGDRRIFGRPPARLADGWVLAVFSVPESERRRRHMLRSRLTSLGYGTVSPGVWVAPAHLETETRDVLERHGLTTYIDLFHADHLAYGDVADHVADWWDLGFLCARYLEFVDAHTSMLAAWRRRQSVDDEHAFRAYVQALTAWRRLPFLDPGLPDEVLPPDWPGIAAAELFASLRRRLSGPAARFVGGVVAAVR